MRTKTLYHFFLLLLLCIVTPLQAQTPLKARDVFRQMPDSILPYLTENNRLDMLDFMDSHMKARVQNQFDGYSEMLSLADDSLTIQMSSVQRLTLHLLPAETAFHRSRQLTCLERTIRKPAGQTQTKRSYYSVLWRKLEEKDAVLVK